MASKEKRRSSTTMIVVAIILGVCFAGLVMQRSGFFEAASDDEATPETSGAVTEVDREQYEVALAKLRSLMAEVGSGAASLPEVPEYAGTIEFDPFFSPEPEVEFEEEEDEPESPKPVLSEKQIQDRYRLRGTCIIGGQSMALINGQYLKKGDALGPLVVEEILEKEVILSINQNQVKIAMPEPR